MFSLSFTRLFRGVVCMSLVCAFSPGAFADVIVGGVGAGSLILRDDGRWDRLAVNNNPHHSIDHPQGCAAAVYVDSASYAGAKWLHEGDAGVGSVALSGGFPLAKAHYQDSGLPIAIELNAFSPFSIEEIDEAVPVVVMRYRLTNPTSSSIDAAVAVSWQNWSGVGGAAQPIYLEGKCKHQAFDQSGLAGVTMGFEPNETPQPIQQNAVGEYTLAAIKQDGASVSLAEIGSSDWFGQFSQDGLVASSGQSEIDGSELSGRRPSSVITIKQTLAPNETKDYVFVLAWRFPNLNTLGGDERSAAYAKRWKAPLNAAQAAEDRWQRWLDEINEWQAPYYASSPPDAFVSRLMNGVGLLAASTMQFDNGETVLLSQRPKRTGQLISSEELLAAAPMLAQVWPELLKDQLMRLGASQLDDGEVPSAAGAVWASKPQGEFLGRSASASAFIAASFYAYLETSDEDFYNEMAPNLRAAIIWLAKQARENQGIPRGPLLLGDAPGGAVSLENVDLYLVALRIGEEIGLWAGDIEFQSICRKAYQEVAERAVQYLWSGRAFTNTFAPSSGPVVEGPLLATGVLQSIGWRPLLGGDLIAARWRMFADSPFANPLPKSWAPGADAASMVLSGYPNAALQALEQSTTHSINAEASLWWTYGALVGAGYHPRNERLIIGPALFGQTQSTYRFQAGGYEIEAQVSRPFETGQVTVSLQFVDVPKKRKIKQIAFRPSAMNTPDSSVLRVLVDGKPAVGQDFASAQLRVFEFSYPQTIRRGDEIVCVFASIDGGRIHIDLSSKDAANYGAYCDIEPAQSGAGAAFRIRNQLRSPQIVFLELAGSTNQAQTVALDGKRIAASSGPGQAVPVLLQTSPLTLEDQQWLERVQWACAQSTRRLAQMGANLKQLNSQLWALQERVDQAVALDAQQRGFLLEITDAEPLLGKETSGRRGLSLADSIDRARTQEADFLENVMRRCPDPVIAARIAGDFAPIKVYANASPAPPKAGAFEVEVESRFSPEAKLDFRVALDLPQQWSATSDSLQAPDEAAKSRGVHQAVFTVKPADDLWKQRRLLSVVITGIWNNRPIRRELSLAVGHTFVDQWMTIGPFTDRRGEAFSALLPPEVDINVSEPHKGIGGDVVWVQREFENGFVDFSSIYQTETGAACAYVSVYSERELPARLEFGGAGDMKVFLNYKEIISQRRFFQPEPGAVIHYFKLFQGWNHFLVKLSKRDGPWGFYFELSDIDGKPIPGLQFALDKA